MADKYTSYVAELQKEFPGFQVKSYLDNWFFRQLWGFGWRMGATTVGKTVFMHPRDIGTKEGYETLRHEAVHLRQQKKWTLPLFIFMYFICLPFGITMRAVWEWEGYAETMQVEFEERGEISDWTVEWIIDMFVGPTYGWMFPFRSTMTKIVEAKRREIMSQALDA